MLLLIVDELLWPLLQTKLKLLGQVIEGTQKSSSGSTSSGSNGATATAPLTKQGSSGNDVIDLSAEEFFNQPSLLPAPSSSSSSSAVTSGEGSGSQSQSQVYDLTLSDDDEDGEEEEAGLDPEALEMQSKFCYIVSAMIIL